VVTFIYAGAFYNDIRDPRPFLEFLGTIENNFKFVIYTKSKGIVEPYKYTLKEKLVVRDFIPRDQVIKEFSKADFVVNIENITDAQSPSKLIDYAIAGRPILSINPHNIDKNKVVEFLNGQYKNQ